MSSFKKYPKVHRLGKEETDGILIGEVHIEEKLDGANASIWLDKRGEITCGSRNRELSEGFDGFVDYVRSDEAISKLLKDHPEFRLYGEWLVRHTISYKETFYKKFYLFDITIAKDGEENEEYLSKEEVMQIADDYGIPRPQYHGKFNNPTLEVINEFVGKTALGEVGEGVVLKNHEFRDAFGNHNHAKVVSEKFKEHNAIVFGGNNKHSDTYGEMYIVNKYINAARVEKIMNKLQPLIEERLDKQHTPRVANTVYHDVLTEEIWEIAKNVNNVNFGALKRVCMRKAIQVYHDLLEGSISVADK